MSFFSLPLASVSFVFVLLFDPEDGGDPFLKNDGLSPIYMVLHLRRLYPSVTAKITSNPRKVCCQVLEECMMAIPHLRYLAVCFSLWRPMLNPLSVF
jgi:hypothetical protein